MARTFLRVLGAASPQRSSMNSRSRVVPSGGSKASRVRGRGVVDRELGKDPLVIAQCLVEWRRIRSGTRRG